MSPHLVVIIVSVLLPGTTRVFDSLDPATGIPPVGGPLIVFVFLSEKPVVIGVMHPAFVERIGPGRSYPIKDGRAAIGISNCTRLAAIVAVHSLLRCLDVATIPNMKWK